MDYGKAILIVQGMVEQLRPYCERIEIGGSIRRGKSDVKDGEIIAIPKPGLLAYVDELLAHSFIDYAEYGEKKTHRWGPLYRGMLVGGMTVELFLADADNWGYIHWLRTGPYEANVWLMKYLSWKKAPVRAKDGYWWWGDKKLRTSSEEELFALLGMPFIPPAGRSEQRYKQLMQNNREHKWPDFSPYVIHVVAPEQSVLPGMQTRQWGFDEADSINASDREKRFEAERTYRAKLPVTAQMLANRLKPFTPDGEKMLTPDPKPENLLERIDFCRIRDELALASYTARLPGLLERCTALRQNIADLHVKLKVFDRYLAMPDLPDRHDWKIQRDIYEAEMVEFYRELQPLDADYQLVQVDIPIRLKRLDIAQQVSQIDAA